MSPGDADLATLFHDLRSPLTAITGAFSVVEACGEDLAPHVRRAVDAGLRASVALDERLLQLEALVRAGAGRGA